MKSGPNDSRHVIWAISMFFFSFMFLIADNYCIYVLGHSIHPACTLAPSLTQNMSWRGLFSIPPPPLHYPSLTCNVSQRGISFVSAFTTWPSPPSPHSHLDALPVMTSNNYRIVNSQSQRIVCSEVQ